MKQICPSPTTISQNKKVSPCYTIYRNMICTLLHFLTFYFNFILSAQLWNANSNPHNLLRALKLFLTIKTIQRKKTTISRKYLIEFHHNACMHLNECRCKSVCIWKEKLIDGLHTVQCMVLMHSHAKLFSHKTKIIFVHYLLRRRAAQCKKVSKIFHDCQHFSK